MIFAFAGTSGQVASDSADDFLTISAFGEPALGIVAAALAVPERAKGAAEWSDSGTADSPPRPERAGNAQFIPFSNWSFVSLTARAVWGKNRSGV